MMKKLLLLLFSTLLKAGASAATPVQKWGQLQVVGTQLCDRHAKPVVLRGVSMGWHNFWPRFYNPQAVSWIAKDWHATVVRAAMGTINNNNYIDNPQHALDCVERVIDGAIKSGIYVIIDWHSHKLQTAEAVKFFGMMARKYGNRPNVIYEIYNEPVEDSWESLKDYARQVIGEIRKYDADNIVLIGCPHWDQDIDKVAASPLTGFTNVMYTVHFYAATHKQELRDRMVNAIHAGVPVFVSESAAMEASGDGPLDAAEWQRWIDTMERLQVSWVNWSVSDKDETCSILLPQAKSTGNWNINSVVKPWGKMVRTALRKYNP